MLSFNILEVTFIINNYLLVAIPFDYLSSDIGPFSKCATKSKYRRRPSMYSIESENEFH